MKKNKTLRIIRILYKRLVSETPGILRRVRRFSYGMSVALGAVSGYMLTNGIDSATAKTIGLISAACAAMALGIGAGTSLSTTDEKIQSLSDASGNPK